MITTNTPTETTKYLTNRQWEAIDQHIRQSKKYRCLIYMLRYLGLRITELLSLQFMHINFREKTIRVRSLKKKRKLDKQGQPIIHWRNVPISPECYRALAEYLPSLKSKEPTDYLFPAVSRKSKQPHLCRKTAWKWISKMGRKLPELKGIKLGPHIFRHHCATDLIVNGTDPVFVQKLLGHSSVTVTTQIYTHIPVEVIRQKMYQASEKEKSLVQKAWLKLFPPKQIQIIQTGRQRENIIIGRQTEIQELADLTTKQVNTLILGPQGIGKSHLLDNIQLQKQVIRLDEFTNVKKTLIQFLLMMLNGDKNQLLQLLYPETTNLERTLNAETSRNLIKLLIEITEQYEYTLIIDDVTKITPSAVKALEHLRNHFHIICAARYIKADKATFLTNFQRIDLKPLSRHESILLTEKLSYDIDIEDKTMFRNHICEQSGGNPQFIYEIIERFRKEEIVTEDLITSIKHGGGREEIDMSMFLLLAIAGLAILRYMKGEVGNDSYQLIGGSAMIILIFSRTFFNYGKKKFI